MSKIHIQMIGLVALSLLSAGLLALISYALYLMGSHISSDGKVPVLDAGLFTSCLLAFQQTIGAIRSIWESQERSTLAEGLQNSTPNTPAEPAPKSAAEGAQRAADSAQDTADEIEGAVTA